MSPHVIGRDTELAILESFLEGLVQGPAAALLEGEAGAGKTTLWGATLDLARQDGARVLHAQPAQSETALSFSGIADLLEPVLPDVLNELPPPQRRAVGVALLVEDVEGPPPDQRAVGSAVLGMLEALSRAGTLLVAVDDVQWLDAASAATLAYAARRLRTEPVGVLLARRTGWESTVDAELRRSLPADRLASIEVGPLAVGALNRVVQHHLGITLPRPLLAEVHEASAGNPFYALEIVRMLQQTRTAVEAGQRLPVPDSLRELVQGRLAALPHESQELLLAAAALPDPTISLAAEASGTSQTALQPALDARVVELERDRIRFTHPLFAASAYESAGPLRRAEVHARLAELVEDPESRARHLAASVTEPDESVAAALEEAARRARGRGAPRAGALLLDRARELTPGDRRDEVLRRAIDAAYLHFESGDSPRAEAQLVDVIGGLDPGRDRARALVRLARVRSYDAQAEAAGLFLQAIEEAEEETEILAAAHEGVSACLFRLRERLDEAVDHAEVATKLALELGDEALAAESVASRLLSETLLGRERAEETASRALALQSAAADRRVLGQPLFNVAVHWWWTDALERARDALVEMLDRARQLGDESSLPYVLVLLGLVECALGDVESARSRALEGKEAAEQSGQHTVFAYNLALESRIEAQAGRIEPARSAALQVLERVAETGGRPAEFLAAGALGHLELALGDPEAAVARLGPIVAHARREAMAEPAAVGFVVDQIEALIELGRRDEAVALLEWYEGNARRLERASALAACARCRGLLAAAEGRLADAVASYAEGLDRHEQVGVPLDRGRTLLALGVAQRRAKRRREARETLQQALELFQRLGSDLWAERARGELRRISGRAPAPGALTPAEQRVAALVAEGKTNREVAAALYLSERTVEGHLSHVYGKLRVRSRTELARELASSATQGGGASNTGDSPVSAGPVAP